jgi:hypothetical protein
MKFQTLFLIYFKSKILIINQDIITLTVNSFHPETIIQIRISQASRMKLIVNYETY